MLYECLRPVRRAMWAIQFLVLADQIVVHLLIGDFEVIRIGLVRCWTRKLHMGPSAK